MKNKYPKTESLFLELLNILDAGIDILPDKSEEQAENTLMALWHFASGNQYSAKTAENFSLPELTGEQATKVRTLIAKRLQGVPLAYLIGRQNFMGIDLYVEKGCYIPRKETELLADTAISLIKNEFVDEKIKVVDVCTGIGTLAVTVAYYNQKTTVFGIDISEQAIEIARRNVRALQLDNFVSMFCGDLLAPLEAVKLKGNVDIILSAPPYISTAKLEDLPPEIKEHEPEAAFGAGAFGLDILMAIVKDAVLYLKDGGYLLFEVGLGQGDFLMKRLKKNKNYSSVRGICDIKNNVRVLIIKK